MLTLPAPYPEEIVENITSYNRMYNHVLIIDDSGIDRIMSEMIINKEGFAGHVVGCGSVMEGLAYLRSLTRFPEKLPDIIFLDVNMPIMDGFDFLDNFMRLKKEIRDRCAIYMISATNSPAELKRIKLYPAVRKFYNKPLTPAILEDIGKLQKKRKS